MSKTTKNFQTEVKQLLDLMINSLYSHREIFLRELVSNASDALDKIKFLELKQPEIAVKDKHIRLTPNKKLKTLTISDNGIGMTYDEVVSNIGTIAYSGTKDFVAKAKKMKDNPELIGQFGVGFYSAFMVADKVTILTRKAGEEEATLWSSNGDGSYDLEKTTKDDGPGTSLILHLKDFSSEENAQDFSDDWTLKSIIKKYSDFIEYPVKMEVTKEEPELDKDGKAIEGKTKTTIEDETLNSQKALWLKPAKDIKKEEYNEFYKHITSDWSEPLSHIHYKAEGAQEFSSLIYFPSNPPFDYNYRDMKYGLSLYVKQVFITDNCKNLLPAYLRFIKGIVDSSDLPLNVSRELLQEDRQITQIQKAVVSKILRHMKSMLEKNRETYEKFWQHFGSTFKEGISSDFGNKDAIVDLILFNSSTSDKMTSLKEYVSRMPEDQKDIYYITGESIDQISNSPYLEKLKAKNYEILFLTDPVDEWTMNSLTEYDKKKVVSVAKEDLDLDSEEEKKAKETELKENSEKFKDLCGLIKGNLEEFIKEVKVSDRLVDSPACLVSGTADPTAHMERIMEKMGQSMPKTKRILEINPKHPAIEKMLTFDSKEKQSLWSEIIYNQALLNEGSAIKDPMKFSKQISDLMLAS